MGGLRVVQGDNTLFICEILWYFKGILSILNSVYIAGKCPGPLPSLFLNFMDPTLMKAGGMYGYHITFGP